MISEDIKNFLNSTFQTSKKNCPIIIAGMPKSGTTVIASLLGQAIGEKVSSDPFNKLDEKGVKFREPLFRGDIDIKNIWRTNKGIFDGGVVKDPNFPFFLEELIEIFPESKVIFIVREPKQNIRSILDRVNLHGNPSCFQGISPNLPPGWKNLLNGSSPKMPGYDYLEKMAWRWRISAEIYQKNKNKITLVRYEDFYNNKKNQIENLASTLGYNIVSDISNNLDFQFQPKGQLITDWTNYFGKDGLKRIKNIVSPIAKELDYE